jgi:hypothetical protein
MRLATVSLIGLAAIAVLSPAARAGEERWSQTWTSDSNHMDFAYALVQPDNLGGSLLVNGTEDDHRRVLRLKESEDGTFVWMRSGSKRWILRDKDSIARAKTVLEPELDMAQDAGDLGTLQGRLGTTQAKLGEEQARIGERQAKLGEMQARLAEQRIRAGDDRQKLRELDEMQEQIDEEMEDLSRAQDRLGGTQSRMGDDQTKMGEEQSRDAERRKGAYAQVRAAMKRLLHDAIDSGAARPN